MSHVARGQSFELAVGLADAFARLSPEAQQIVRVLSSVPERMRDPAARLEVRGFLRSCEAAGVDITAVDQARMLLATFEGNVGGDGATGVVSLPVPTTEQARNGSARSW